MPALSPEELAAQYGFALAFLKSDKSLYALFQSAVKETWSTDKFVAKLRTTSWYKTNSESARQYKVLEKTDPKTLSVRISAVAAQMRDTAAAMGANVPDTLVTGFAKQALMLNWNDAQIRDVLAKYVGAKNGIYNGQAGSDVASLRQVAWRNGVQLSESTLQSMAMQIAQGSSSVGYFQTYVRNQAKALAPQFAAELDGGLDLYDIASPYMQAKAKILELDPAAINLFDQDVRSALAATTKDGNPASMSLWQFEQKMRRDPRWLKTQNAQDSVMGTARQVLSDMGVLG